MIKQTGQPRGVPSTSQPIHPSQTNFSQNTPGVGSSAESGDLFGWALAGLRPPTRSRSTRVVYRIQFGGPEDAASIGSASIGGSLCLSRYSRPPRRPKTAIFGRRTTGT